ncbi:helix-turn-helix domain-containing protein [Sulfitobacter aestuarii]|uniref:Helix-turn-helix domain-containing protein n=1 Tax=Sulfitobacter aestuarii TaxID=2161676 RepID=A0ABW5U5U0_9RHOB
MKLNRSIQRGLLVLQTISDSGPSSLAFLADRTGLAKPTLLRICATMEAARWLTRRSGDGRYQLGTAFPSFGAARDQTEQLVEAGCQEIVQLSEDTGLGADLASAIGRGRVEIVDSTRHFNLHEVYPDCIGFRPSPFRSALGLAYLAALPEERRIATLRDLKLHAARNEASALAAFPQRFRDFLARGYAIREDGYWGRAVDYGAVPSAIAVPILAKGHPVGALNLVWAAKNHTVPEVAQRHLATLQKTAAAIGQRMPPVLEP